MLLLKWFEEIFPRAKGRRVLKYRRYPAKIFVSDKEQLKAEIKGNFPYKADPLDESQMEKMWTTGNVDFKIEHPTTFISCDWWNDTRMLGMRGQAEHLNRCKLQDRGNYYEYTD